MLQNIKINKLTLQILKKTEKTCVGFMLKNIKNAELFLFCPTFALGK
jgi:hypothetical protein